MHLHVYILTKGDDAEDAECDVRCFIDDQVGEGKWFDYGGIDETTGVRTLPLYVVRKELQRNLEYVYNVELKRALEQFDAARKTVDTEGKPLFNSDVGALGYPASLIADICYQEFKHVMPFFNRQDFSWLLPGENEDGLDDEGYAWYAVPVDLHC
jgi:hypothetical protein